MAVQSIKQMVVYEKSYDLAMELFEVSKTFPVEERYSLTSQIRRSSRSVCANLREAWAKRQYAAHFVSKLTDADAEINETDTWLDFAFNCGYISMSDHQSLLEKATEIGRMIGSMMRSPQKFAPVTP